MRKLTLTLSGLLMVAASFAQGGFEFKLQLMQEELTWGVYMQVVGDDPVGNMVTASGQVTVVMPADFEFLDTENHNGAWDANAVVISPIEDVERKYVSFGLVQAEPLYPIPYTQSGEVLLFSFKGTSCPDSLYLIDCNTPNVNDPFCPDYIDNTPGLNSAFTNPGNDLSVIDLGQGGAIYFYQDNYARSSWNCHDCDADGIPNAHEDTNGNGVYDPGEDASDLCEGGADPCEGITPTSAVVSGGGAACAGEGSEIFVEISGGTGPFLVVLSDGTQNIYVEDYESGTSIPVNPQVPTQYTLVRVEAGPVCELTDGLSGAAIVTVANALELLDSPIDVETCEGEEVEFSASVSNTNGSLTEYVWEQSCDGGNTWEEFSSPNQTVLPTLDATLSISNALTSLDECEFRLRAWTAECGEVVSEPAALSVSALPEITQQPQAQESCEGQAVVFEVGVADDADIFWRKSCDGGATWQLIFPGDPDHGGMLTNTLTVFSAKADDNGCIYQALIDDVASGNLCGTNFSQPAELSVKAVPQISQPPVSQTVCQGENAVFEILLDSDADGLGFQWQRSCDNGQTWADISENDPAHFGVNSTGLSVASAPDLDGCQYRITVTSECGDAISQPALLNAKAPVAFGEMPADQLACPGEIIEFSAQASAFGTIAYQWEMSADGLDYQPITNPGAGDFAGFDSPTLAVGNAEAVEGFAFRLSGNTAICPEIKYSEAATVAIRATIEPGLSPENIHECEGESVAFFGNIDPAGQDNVQLNWQLQVGTDWVDLTEGPNFSGTQSEELFIADNSGYHGSLFRLSAAGECREVATESALLTTEDCSIDSNFLELKIGRLPQGNGWGVYLRLAGGFEPHDYQTALSGRVVIATSDGFGFHSLLSQAAGTWTTGTVVLENWQHPETRYFTFDLEPNDNQLLLEPGKEIMLFSFKGIGDCPKQMFILEDEGELPNGLEPTEFSAVDLDENYLFFSRTYDLGAWNCHGSNALMANPNTATEITALSNTLESAPQNTEDTNGTELNFAPQNGQAGIGLSPNPATAFVNISVNTKSENAQLHIMGMEGKILETIPVGTDTRFRMDINHLPTGLYLVALEENGVVVHREKLVIR